MYGNEIGDNKFQKVKNNFSKYYNKDYYIELGLSEEEAKLKIEDFKKNKATNLKNFIKKYGDELGVEKYNQFVNDSKNTIGNFKKGTETIGKKNGITI